MKLNGLTVPMIQGARKIRNVTIDIATIREGTVEYRRQKGVEGQGYMINFLASEAEFNLLGEQIDRNRIVWITEFGQSDFHALGQLSMNKTVNDVSPFQCRMDLLVRENAFDPTKYDPVVFA